VVRALPHRRTGLRREVLLSLLAGLWYGGGLRSPGPLLAWDPHWPRPGCL